MFSTESEFDAQQFVGLSGQGLGVFPIGEGDNLYFSHPGHNIAGATCMLIASPVKGKGAIMMVNGLRGAYFR